MKGIVGFIGFMLVFGSVGGMDNPEQADYLGYQILAALIGLAMMFWTTKYLTKQA